MLPIAGVLGGLSVLKGILDASKKSRENKAQAISDAAAIKYSPWSGLNTSNLVGKDYSSQGALSGAVEGGLAGYQTGSGIENSIADQGYRKELADYYMNKNNPGTDIGKVKLPEIPSNLAVSAAKKVAPYSELDYEGQQPHYGLGNM